MVPDWYNWWCCNTFKTYRRVCSCLSYVSLHVKNVMKSVPLFATMRVAERKVGVRTLSVIEHLIFWHFSTSNSHFNFSHLRFLSFHVRSRLGTKTETAMLILRSFRSLPTHLSTRDISRSSFNQQILIVCPKTV